MMLGPGGESVEPKDRHVVLRLVAPPREYGALQRSSKSGAYGAIPSPLVVIVGPVSHASPLPSTSTLAWVGLAVNGQLSTALQ